MAIMATYSLVDTIFIGRGVGTLGIGGIAVVFPFQMFILAIGHPAEWLATYSCDYRCANDINCDGNVNAYDIDGFVRCVSQGYCDPCP